jgi:hypothetical protein
MLDAWSAQRLQVYAVTRSVQTLTPAKAAYTIGPDVTADFNAPRPARLEDARIISGGGGTIERGLEILTPARWAAIPLKTLSGLPSKIYYETSIPLGTLRLWPVPVSADSLVLYTWQTLPQVVAGTDNLVIPPAYHEALMYNLAIRLGTEWGKPARQDLLELAAESLAVLKSFNAPTYEATVDSALLGRRVFDIMTGDYR